MKDPLSYFLSIKNEKHPFCLYSGERGEYSYVGFDPKRICKVYPHYLEIDGKRVQLTDNQNPFDFLEEIFLPTQTSKEGFLREGWVGFWAYEMGQFADEGFPKRNLPEDFLLGWWGYYEGVKTFDSNRKDFVETNLVGADLCVCPGEHVGSPLQKDNKQSYLSSLSKILSYIEAGDCYQVNFSQKFELPLPDHFSPEEKFIDLVLRHPAPFSAYLDCGEKKIISASPEEFISIQGDEIRTTPIKGTRPRAENPEEDQKMKKELENSEKEKAELLMIVDLERNDLGKVCEIGSVKVSDLRKIESFDYVHHAMAEVRGKKKKNCSALQVTRALFPGGSITGAPKKRAMEIIQELETEPRGIYTGAIGFYDASGLTGLNIAIRTLEIEKGKIRFGMGGGIVADSDPEKEYEELFVKAKVFLE